MYNWRGRGVITLEGKTLRGHNTISSKPPSFSSPFFCPKNYNLYILAALLYIIEGKNGQKVYIKRLVKGR